GLRPRMLDALEEGFLRLGDPRTPPRAELGRPVSGDGAASVGGRQAAPFPARQAPVSPARRPVIRPTPRAGDRHSRDWPRQHHYSRSFLLRSGRGPLASRSGFVFCWSAFVTSRNRCWAPSKASTP